MRWKALKQVFWGFIRVQLYVLGVGSLLAYVSYVRAKDKAEHVLGELGIGLLSGLGSLEAGVEEVEINGQRFVFGAATSTDDPEALVDEFRAHCEDASGSLAKDLAPLVAEAKRKGAKIPSDVPVSAWTSFLEYTDDRHAAQSGCFVRPGDSEEGSMLKRLERFATTGQLGTLGGFRYLRADRREDSDYTRVLAISSDGAFDLDAMLPESGDAHGTDPTIAPRPPKAVRILSARIVDSGQGAYLYESDAPKAELLKFYEGTLSAKNLAAVELPHEQEPSLKDSRVYASDNGAVLVSVHDDEDDKRTVTVIEFGHFEPTLRNPG